VTHGADRRADHLAGEPGTAPTATADRTGSAERSGAAKAQDAYASLHRAIRDGTFPPGSRLKEVELARRLGMSRTPIREAIRRLERDGVVTVAPNRGAIVRELSEQEIDDTYSLRAVLEGYCAGRAATRITPDGLRRLIEIHEEFERRSGPDGSLSEPGDEGNSEAAIRLNQAFHAEILAGSENTRVIDLLQNAVEVPVHMKDLFWRSPQATRRAMMSHSDIIDALRAGDAIRADVVMRAHVYALRDFYIQEHRALHREAVADGDQ